MYFIQVFILFLFIAISFVFLPVQANAMTWVDGHYRSGSGWVEGHWRTEPDSYEWNNLGSDGIDRDHDGYGAGETNSLYSHYDFHSTPSLDYDTDYGVDTYDSYGSDWGSGWDTGSTWSSDYDLDW